MVMEDSGKSAVILQRSGEIGSENLSSPSPNNEVS